MKRFSGTRLRALRTAKQWRIERLAFEADKSTATVRSYELGAVVPGANTVGRLADVFGIAVDDLYEDVEVAA